MKENYCKTDLHKPYYADETQYRKHNIRKHAIFKLQKLVYCEDFGSAVFSSSLQYWLCGWKFNWQQAL